MPGWMGLWLVRGTSGNCLRGREGRGLGFGVWDLMCFEGCEEIGKLVNGSAHVLEIMLPHLW